MTPLAAKVANELTLPLAKRGMSDDAKLMDLINQDLHCFEVTAVGKAVQDAMEAQNVWPEAETMLPHAFLPSPTTWLEMLTDDGSRLAWVLEDRGDAMFRLSMVRDRPDLFSVRLCDFRARGLLETGSRIEVISLIDERSMKEIGYNAGYRAALATLPEGVARDFTFDKHIQEVRTKHSLIELDLARSENEAARLSETIKWVEAFNHGIAWCILMLDLINTPGLIGLRQRDPHRGLVKRLSAVGSYPLRSWSEVVLKHQTRHAEPGERVTGATYHKCLHFVRSHLRHYRNGRVTVIPAHWRGDPALGIKRTRYRLAA